MIGRLENPERSISGRPSQRSFLQGAGSLLAVGTDWVRTESTRPWTPLFKIDRISKHVYAAIAQTTPVVNGNSAIIVTKRGLVHGCHAFRRGLATNLHALGVDDKTIQAILRHSNVSLTQNIYIKSVMV